MECLPLYGGSEGYVLHLRGMDEHDAEDCDDDWNALVAEVEALPVFKTIDEAREAYRTLNMHGYDRTPLEVYDGT